MKFSKNSLIYNILKYIVLIFGIMILPLVWYSGIIREDGVDTSIFFIFVSILTIILGLAMFHKKAAVIGLITAMIILMIWFFLSLLGIYPLP